MQHQPGQDSAPARLALMAVRMTIFAPTPARGQRGSKIIPPHLPARKQTAASAKLAAGKIRLTLPCGRTTRASSAIQPSSVSAPARWARSRRASGEAVLDSPNQGGLARTWSKDCDAKGRAVASPCIAEIPCNPLILKFSLASAASSAACSTPMPRSPATLAPRHSKAAPAPVPDSSTVSPARARTQAASSTGSNPLR